MYSGLYSDFQRLNVERYFYYKLDKVFCGEVTFWKKYFLDLVKTNMRRHLINMSKSNIFSKEIIIHDKYAASIDKIDDLKFNDQQIDYSVAKFYQKKDNINFILIHFFSGKEYMNI